MNVSDGYQLHLAAIEGDLERVAELLAAGRVGVDAADATGASALTLATAHGHVAVVELLLARGGVDVNAKDGTGSTALAIAAGAGAEQLVDLLLARDDVDVNLVDGQRMSPLYRAVAGRHTEVVRRLLDHPATNVELTSRPFTATPLDVALEQGDDAIAELLRAAAPAHSFGDVLSEADDYVAPEQPAGPQLIPRMPYEDEPWPRPPMDGPLS